MTFPNKIILPELLPWQADVFNAFAAGRRNIVVNVGRQAGKTSLNQILMAGCATRGWPVGIFFPSYKHLIPVWEATCDFLRPAIKSANKTDKRILLHGGGEIDFWSCKADESGGDVGRGRTIKLAVLDEGAFIPHLDAIYNKSIRASLARYNGTTIITSTPNGANDENYFYTVCKKADEQNNEGEWWKYHAPSSKNPLLSREFLEGIKRDSDPRVWRQEYLAEFVSWAENSLFDLDRLGPVRLPECVSYVFAASDSTLKGGAGNDATAVAYFARIVNLDPNDRELVLLDWDATETGGATLAQWYPKVAARLDELAAATNALRGSVGIWIEDKAAGSVVLPQLREAGIDAKPIPGRIVAMGKDGRAYASTGPVASGKVGIARQAWEKAMPLKGKTKNHMLEQIASFRLDDPKAARRADDCLDAFTSGILLGFA